MPKPKQAELLDIITKAWNRRVPFLTHRTDEGKAKLAQFLAYIYRNGMTNLNQSKEELKLQEISDLIYKAVFDAKLPYRTFYTAGYTDQLYQTVHLSKFIDVDDDDDLDLLCHELVHVYDFAKPHGKRFEKKVDSMVDVARHLLQ